MSTNRKAKQTLVDAIGSGVKDAELLVVLKQVGLNADETLDFRRQMRAAGVSVKIAKNTLVKKAFHGTKLEKISDLLKGPIVLVYSSAKGSFAAAKVAYEFSKKNKKLSILGAAYEDQILDVAGATTLAMLPSLDELRGKLVGLLQAPGAQIARVLSARSKQDA